MIFQAWDGVINKFPVEDNCARFYGLVNTVAADALATQWASA